MRAIGVLAATLLLVFAAPAAAVPVATSEDEYAVLGAVFPDPLGGCQVIAPPACDPKANGNVPAQTFIGVNEFRDALAFMNTKTDWQRYMEVLILDGKDGEGSATKAEVQADPAVMFPGNNLGTLEFEPKPAYISAGIPTSTLARQKSDLTIVRVTDETVPDEGKKRMTLSLSIHGIERAGAEGGTRAMEDLVTAFTRGTADQPLFTEEVRAGAPTPTDVLKRTIIYFTYPNPDGWRRGTFDAGGLGSVFQRYNGNGVDPNRDYTDIGYNFRGYSGGSEPETRAFKGFYRGVQAGGGSFQAGDDLHGQPFADALSYTLMPHGRHDLAKDTRIREAAKVINRAQYHATKWSPIIKENDEVSVPQTDCVSGPIGAACPQIFAQTWGSVYDTINYTTTGTLGDWFDSTEGLGADGIDNEMSFSHVDAQNTFRAEFEQLHVAGNKAIIYAHLSDLLAPVTGELDAPGKQGYVPNVRATRAESAGPSGPPPNTVAQEDVDDEIATPDPTDPTGRTIFNFTVEQTAPSEGSPGIFNGGMRIDATMPNLNGVSTGSAKLEIQCRHCDDHVGAPDAGNEEWVTVAEDYNQAGFPLPLYGQAGATAAVNRPDATFVAEDGKLTPVEWRAVASFNGSAPIGPVHIYIDFTQEPATDDGSSGGDDPPRLKGYDVANTDFFEDLNKYIADPVERFQKIEPRRVISGEQSLDGLKNLVLADEILPGYTGALAGLPPDPQGPPTADLAFAGSGTTVPGQGAEECERTADTTDQFEFSIPPTDANRQMTVHIEWLAEASDYDMFLMRKIGDEYQQIADSASFVTFEETIDVPRPPAGDYRVDVVNCSATPADPFAGTVTFEAFGGGGVPASAYTEAEKDQWVAKLRSYVTGGGNLVLTDGALRGIQELTPVDADKVNRQTIYVGQITLTRCKDAAYQADGTCTTEEQTLDDPLMKNVNQPGSRFNSGFRRQVFEPTPLGYAIQNRAGAAQANARQFDIEAKAFTDAGGHVAATSADTAEAPVSNRVTVGEIPIGAGRVRVAGALLPQPSQDFDHPLGIEPYAATYTGYILICNLLDANCSVKPAPSGGGGGDAPGGGPGAVPGGGGQTPTPLPKPDPTGGAGGVCASTAGFASTSAKRSGRGLAFRFTRRVSNPVSVDVFWTSKGRRIVQNKLVARFTNKRRGFRWNGKGTRGDGLYFVRLKIRTAAGKVDYRRHTFERRGGKFRSRTAHYARVSCGLLTSYKLEYPGFGGSSGRPLRIAYRLSRRADITVVVARRAGGKVVKTFRAKNSKAGTSRLTLPARGLRRGDYVVRLTAKAGSTTVRSTLGAKLL